MAPEKKHSEHFRVRPVETDYRGWLSLGAMAGYLQDTAGVHAGLLGFGVGDLLRRNMTWMLSRLRLEIMRRVDCGEELTVNTWPSGSERLFTFREFRVTDKTGQPVAKATTAWLTIEINPDNNAKRIMRPQKELEQYYLTERVFALPLEKISIPQELTHEYGFAVRKGQIDINRHANNLAYVEWIMESVPDEVYFTCDCGMIEINYNAEMLSGESGRTLAAAEDGNSTAFVHRIVRHGSDEEICRARTVWGRLERPVIL